MPHVPRRHGGIPGATLPVKAMFTQKSGRLQEGTAELKLLPVWKGTLPTPERSDVTLALQDRDLMPQQPAGTGAVTSRRLWRVTLSLWLGLFAAELIASIVLCGGRLVFTPDDLYIHLAVADHILTGGYRVNASEYASPSSSIIWPYLLALTEAPHLGAFGPLMIAAAAAAATMVAVLHLIESFCLTQDDAVRLCELRSCPSSSSARSLCR